MNVTVLDDDAAAAMQQLFKDAQALAVYAASRDLMRKLRATLVEAFVTRTTAAWISVFNALRALERGAAGADSSALVRIRAFLAENADLASAGARAEPCLPFGASMEHR